jgi:hypothetical protein
VIKDHEALLGILLGFGRNNAWLFHNKRRVMRELDEFGFPLKRTDLLEKELAEINRQMDCFGPDLPYRTSVLKKPYIPLLCTGQKINS